MFRETVSAICYEIGEFHFAAADAPELAPPYNDVAEFVLEQWQRMPDYLRLPIRLFTVIFGLWPLARTGCIYSRNPLGARRLQRMLWRSSRLAPFRDLLRYYESLATLALYSRPIHRRDAADAG